MLLSGFMMLLAIGVSSVRAVREAVIRVVSLARGTY